MGDERYTFIAASPLGTILLLLFCQQRRSFRNEPNLEEVHGFRHEIKPEEPVANLGKAIQLPSDPEYDSGVIPCWHFCLILYGGYILRIFPPRHNTCEKGQNGFSLFSQSGPKWPSGLHYHTELAEVSDHASNNLAQRSPSWRNCSEFRQRPC